MRNKSTCVVVLLGTLLSLMCCGAAHADNLIWSNWIPITEASKIPLQFSVGREPNSNLVYTRIFNGSGFQVSGALSFGILNDDNQKLSTETMPFEAAPGEVDHDPGNHFLIPGDWSKSWQTKTITIKNIHLTSLFERPSVDSKTPNSIDFTAPLAANMPEVSLTVVPVGLGDNSQIVHYGYDYLRVTEEFLYLVPHDHKQLSYHATVGVVVDPSKAAPAAKFDTVDLGMDKNAQEKQDRNNVYSSRGEHTILPGVALNVRAPITIRQEVRTLNRNSRYLEFLQTVFHTVATIIPTSPVGITASGLATSTATAQQSLSTYEQQTELADHNDYEWNHDNVDFPAIPKTMIGLFTKGKPFKLIDDYGNDVFVTEEMLANKPFGKIKDFTNFTEGFKRKWKNTQIPNYQTAINVLPTPTPAKQSLIGAGEGGTTTDHAHIAYPSGHDSYVVLRLELYERYPNLENHPEDVPGTKQHFVQLDTILRSAPSGKTLQGLVDDEGEKLIATLQTLTSSGEVSLDDATKLVAAFCRRAQYYNGNRTSFSDQNLESSSRCFDTSGQYLKDLKNAPPFQKK